MRLVQLEEIEAALGMIDEGPDAAARALRREDVLDRLLRSAPDLLDGAAPLTISGDVVS